MPLQSTPTSVAPSNAPSLIPTTIDTVSFLASISLSASQASCLTESEFRKSLSGKLGGAELSAVQDMELRITTRNRHLVRTDCSWLYTGGRRVAECFIRSSLAPSAERFSSIPTLPVEAAHPAKSARGLEVVMVTFRVSTSLMSVDFVDAKDYERALLTDLSDGASDGSLAGSLQTNSNCTNVVVETVAIRALHSDLNSNNTSRIPTTTPTVVERYSLLHESYQDKVTVLVGSVFVVGLSMAVILSGLNANSARHCARKFLFGYGKRRHIKKVFPEAVGG